MKYLLPLTFIMCPLLLTGCEKESDTLPADGRDFDAQAYIAGKPYTGKVMNGYLQNARVWLDLDGDGQYTQGPLTVENESGVELVLEGGEPTTMTGVGGEFSLDVSELEQDPLISADLDPRNYPLIALALPGRTIEQTDAGDQVLDQAFMLNAPPGVRTVTPLTTLVRQRRANGIGEFVVGNNALALALGNINLVSDYVRSGDQRAQAYASAFARFLASQLRPYKDALGKGLNPFLSPEAVRLMGISFARNALTIVETVDEAAPGGDYAAVDIDSLNLPEIELELDDSVIVSSQTVFASAVSDSSTSFAGLEIRAKLAFNYSESARLTSVEADGCMMPSLTEMVRLINANGKIAATGTQWMPTVSLNQQSGTFYEAAGIDERLTFDWENGTAAFETTTTCHGDLADSSEFGELPEIAYEWTLHNNGQVETLTATSAGKTEVLTPDYTNSSDFFIGYKRTVNSVDNETVKLQSEPVSCLDSVADVDKTKPHVVSAIHPFTVSGAIPIPAGFTNLGLELDTRELDGIQLSRPLRYGFQNQEFLDTDGVTNSDGFEWKFYYPTVASGRTVADQPNLIRTAYLASYSGDKECGRDFGTIPTSTSTQVGTYARVEYTYQRLSEYLAGQVQ